MAQTDPQIVKAPKLKNWTVMVYMAGDNNLAEEMIFALKDMHSVGSTKDVQVVAWSDTVGALVPFDIPEKKAKQAKEPSKKYKKAAQYTPDQQVPAPTPVTETNDLKERLEEFLEEKKRFTIKAKEAEIEQIREALIDAEEQVLGVRQEHGEDKNLEKARTAQRKLEEALEEGSKAVLTEPTGGSHLVKATKPAKRKRASSRKPKPRVKVENDEDALRLEMSRFATETPVSDILTAFIVDSIKRYPAHNYALILSGHGSGAVGDFLTSSKQVFSLSIPGLSEALVNAGNECGLREPDGEPWLDVLGFDSCLMSMAEVAYEVRESVKYMVSAEGFETATGWPYDRILTLLHEKSDLEPRAFASKIVDEHIDYYDDYTVADVSVDLSALALTHIGKLVDELAPKSKRGRHNPGLAGLLKNGLKVEAVKDAIVLAHWEAQGYKNEQYADLWDFCECLAKRTEKIRVGIASEISKACRRVQDSIAPRQNGKNRTTLVYRSGFRGPEFQYSHGVSIFFPWADLKDAAEVSEVDHYGLLAFAEDSEWDEFLREYFRATIRDPRGGSKKLRHSFINVRPFLFTGNPEKPRLDGVRTPPFSTRTPPFSTRTPPFSTRTPPFSTRTSGGLQPDKIASMKNPPINWLELKRGQT